MIIVIHTYFLKNARATQTVTLAVRGNYMLFTDWINVVNNKGQDNAKDLDVVIPI